MKFTNRVKNAISAFNENKANNSLQNPAADFLRYGNRKPMLQDWSQVEMSDEDMYTGYSYAAINKRANRASVLGKNFLYTKATDALMESAKKADKTVEHPYLPLISGSKEFAENDFWREISTYLDLEGIYYLMAVRAVAQQQDGTVKVGAIQKFVLLNPYEVRRVVSDANGTIGGYIESRYGMYREIPKEMIIEIRSLNPFQKDVPFSMTDAAKESQFTMKQAGDYTRHSIKGNINAPGSITTDVVLEPEVFDNFVRRIENHTKGEPLYGNGAGAINWSAMQIDLDKAALDKINEIHRQILFAVSGTSKTTLGIEESGTTRDTSQVQKDNFTEDAVMPQIEKVIDALNLDYRKWYPEWDKTKYEICLDNPLESDREAELKDVEIREKKYDVTQKLVQMGYEYDLAAKYAAGEITLQELGEPTLEPELTTEQADIIAAREMGLDTSAQEQELQDNPENADTYQNRVTAKNKFVPREYNEKLLKEARKRVKARIKADKDKAKAEKTAKKTEKQTKTDTPLQQEESEPVAKVEVQITTPQNSLDKTVNQIAARDYPGLYDDLVIDQRAISSDEYRGCIMLNTEKIPVAQYVKDSPNDLHIEEGGHTTGLVGEIEPHVSLLFGLLNNGNTWKDKVDTVLRGWKCNTVTIKEVSFFDLGDSYAIIGLVEKTDELIDGHERLTLLPHVSTFSDYTPHITLAYINHDVDPEKWVKPLGKKYNGQKVATRGINYGDLPEDDTEADNHVEDEHDMSKTTKAKKKDSVSNKAEASQNNVELSSAHVEHNHEHEANKTLERAKNALDLSVQDRVMLQESNLERAVARLENDIAQKVLEAIRNGDVNEAEEIISEAQEEQYAAELAIILAGFFTVLFPIYAAQLMFARLAQFGMQGVFEMSQEVKNYIKISAEKAAVSHVQTVIKDLAKAYNTSHDKVVRDALVSVIEEKANARDTKVLGKLPKNPNREDIEQAVDEGRFDEDPAYKTARDKVREGAGFEEIAKAVKNEYTHISQTRAKTIARHEANRVFNMSQYQADVQFLNESGLMSRAYKRLRNRADDPCPVCALLVQSTKKNPIPFGQNFADLGDELTATYTKNTGKLAVQKISINYEAIIAGNVHVNCRCEYELVLKSEDGKWLNNIDIRIEDNDVIKNYSPTQPRDGDGQWTDGGGTSTPSPRSYDGMKPNDFEQAVKEDYGDQAEWTAEESKAIDHYTATGYTDMNRYLRNPKDEMIYDKDKIRKYVDLLDSAMKNELKEDTNIYRGLVTTGELEVGGKIEAKGYSSSSFFSDTAEDFAKSSAAISGNKEKRPLVLKIKAKKGQKGIIPMVEGVGSGLRGVEGEFLLPRDISFIIKKVTDKGDFEQVEVEIVNG